MNMRNKARRGGLAWLEWRSCSRKTRYGKPTPYHEQLAKLQGLRYYKCPYCPHYHLTHKAKLR